MTSLPYARIPAVSYVADRSVFGKFASSSTVAITVSGGGVHEVEFRGEEKARHAHDYILWAITH